MKEKSIKKNSPQPVAEYSACPICKNTEYTYGPKGHKERNGKYPKCTKCGSLEWDRALREIWLTLKGAFRRCMALQLSDDISLPDKYFPNIEKSIYGKEESLDPQDIARPSSFYDVVVCNHVLEYLEDDGAAIKELIRIVKPASGILQISVADPMRLEKTEEYGQAREDEDMRLRTYGADFIERLAKSASFHAMTVESVDPITQGKELVFFICRSRDSLLALHKKLQFSCEARFFPE